MNILLITAAFTHAGVGFNVGDIITAEPYNAERYAIRSKNGKPVFSVWVRKAWLESHSKLKTN